MTYYLVLFILKVKNIKKMYQQNPINIKSVRKGDVKYPKDTFFKSNNILRYKDHLNQITAITNPNSQKLIIYIPGGAFISGPAQHHWDTIKTIYKSTHQNIWLLDYPKAPEYKIDQIQQSVLHTYKRALNQFKPNKITIIGDSAGATLALCLKNILYTQNINLPFKTIAICPVIDPTMSNPEILLVEKKDPILAVKGVLSAKKMCVNNSNLSTPLLSPKLLPLHIFSDTIFLLAQNDIMFPDAFKLTQQLKQQNINHQVIIGQGMPHIWPILPVMSESKKALKQIIAQL